MTTTTKTAPCFVCSAETPLLPKQVLCPTCRANVDATLAANERQDGAVTRAARRIRTVWCCVTCDAIRFEDSALPPTSGRCSRCGEQGIERCEVVS